jgi:pre-mRNA-splicing factor SYF1
MKAVQGLPHHEDILGGDSYNVNAWAMYMEEIDAMIKGKDIYVSNDSTTAKKSKKTQSQNSTKYSLPELVQLRDMVARRSIRLLPRSYKLWKLHWEFIVKHMQHLGGPSTVLGCFERSMVTLHKFPKAWMAYLEFAHTLQQQEEQPNNDDTNSSNNNMGIVIHPTQLRHLVNRSLEALPVTQHDKIWPVLLKYYQSNSLKTAAGYIPKETKLSVLRRYVQYNPGATKEVADFLADELGHWGEAALMYVDLLNHDDLRDGASSSGNKDVATTSAAQRKDLWMSLAKICTRHSVEDEIGLDFEAIVRAILTNSNNSHSNVQSSGTGALRYLPREMEGVLWSQLADAWIRRGEFQLARSVYEEAIESVSRVRDFTILMDAYLQFEEGLLEANMESQAEMMDEDEPMDVEGKEDSGFQNDDGDENDWDILLSQQTGEDGKSSQRASMSDLELALARAEDLTERRPILLNGVLLRQNPDDVGEWLKRARMYKETGKIHQAAAALEEGLKTVKARRAVGGNANQMVVQLAKIYEEDCKDVAKARNLFDRICNQYVYEFKNVDDLAECFVTWVELELRQETWDDALDIIRASVVLPRFAPKWTRGLKTSLRLWDLLLDLEESLGTMQTAKDAYGRAIDHKVATPLHILNFATFLTEQKYFEESFSAYERGIELFQFPGVKLIWKAYVDSFLKRYGGTKLERTRDLFQRCLDGCPPEDSTEFFLMNGKFEEEHGLTKRALGVYKQMCQTVPGEDKYTAYQLFITKTVQYLGQTATRDIYQNAIQDLEDGAASKLCLDFANMETSLQEIDRARAVLSYGAQMADPRRNDEYWKAWNEFEISHGNEETFREMLRIKRSAEASFSTVNYNAAEMSGVDAKATEALSNEDAMKMIAQREGVELNPGTQTISGFVASSSSGGGKRSAQAASLEDMEERVAKLRKAAGTADQKNDKEGGGDGDGDEIDIDELVDELEGDADEIDIEDEDEESDNDDAKDNNADKNQVTEKVQDVSTKAVPAAVFGGLVKST